MQHVKLHELMLREEFKNCVPDCLFVYLNEQKASALKQASMLLQLMSLDWHINTLAVHSTCNDLVVSVIS